VAELLGLPLVSSVVAVEVTDGGFRLRRDMEDGYQTVRAPMPSLLLTSTGLNEPRFPSLKGIMAAKKKPIERVPQARRRAPGRRGARRRSPNGAGPASSCRMSRPRTPSSSS
jgi:electron transfer flavoprotein beta subunit